jgi:hypothetical protein
VKGRSSNILLVFIQQLSALTNCLDRRDAKAEYTFPQLTGTSALFPYGQYSIFHYDLHLGFSWYASHKAVENTQALSEEAPGSKVKTENDVTTDKYIAD